MRFALASPPYVEQNIIASAQRCVNLYAESNQSDPQAPTPFTYYQTPGTQLYSVAGSSAKTRCTFRTSKGKAYVVIGPTVYFLASNRALIPVGNILDRESQVYMADNGIVAVIVDGSGFGWVVNLADNSFGEIIDPAFYGADMVVFLDSFFAFNRPDTNQFYISLSYADFGMLTSTAISNGTIAAGSLYTNGVYAATPLEGGSGTGATATITVAGNAVTIVSIDDPGINYAIGDVLTASTLPAGAGFTYTITDTATAFDPLDIASKSGSADPIVGIYTTHKELVLVGELTTEVWIGTGAADFYFQLMQGAYIDHGCAAPYSIASQDVLTFYISQDKQGSGVVIQAVSQEIKEISTPRIVEEFKSYTTLADAIGFCFQISDHPFYALVFPTANKSWLYDLKTGYWNEWLWFNQNSGLLERTRANCAMFVYGYNLIGDYANGILWELNPNVYTDGNPDTPLEVVPIQRIRAFPHMLIDGARVNYQQFIADMQCGTATDGETDHDVTLRWSDDRGVSYGNGILQSLGAVGEYNVQPSWWRLGQARDRVFELSWSSPIKTVLNGAWVERDGSRYQSINGQKVRGT